VLGMDRLCRRRGCGPKAQAQAQEDQSGQGQGFAHSDKVAVRPDRGNATAI